MRWRRMKILQIVVFAVFFAVALGAMPDERRKPIMAIIDDLATSC